MDTIKGHVQLEDVPEAKSQLKNLKRILAYGNSQAAEMAESAAHILERCTARDVCLMLVPDTESLMAAFAAWVEPDDPQASSAGALCVLSQLAAAKLLSTLVALVRRGSGGLSKDCASNATCCATALVRLYLSATNKAKEAQQEADGCKGLQTTVPACQRCMSYVVGLLCLFQCLLTPLAWVAG